MIRSYFSLSALPALTKLVAKLAFVLARLFDPSFNPCGVIMSDKLVFELVIRFNGSGALGTSLRMIDSKSVTAVANIIKCRAFGLKSKSDFFVHIVSVYKETPEGLHFSKTALSDGNALLYGADLITVYPFFIKKSGKWVVNDEIIALVGSTHSS